MGMRSKLMSMSCFFLGVKFVVLFARLASGVTVPVLFAALCGQHVAGTGVRVGLAASYIFCVHPRHVMRLVSLTSQSVDPMGNVWT